MAHAQQVEERVKGACAQRHSSLEEVHLARFECV
jgi:hypothetical protein